MYRRTSSLALIALVTTGISLAIAGAAGAVTAIRTPQGYPDLGGTHTGDLLTYDLYLDIPVNDGLVNFSMGVLFDPTFVSYRQDLSVSNDDGLLYTPGSGKMPGSWLEPVVGSGPDPFAPDGPGFDTWPTPPPGLAQVNVDFRNQNLGAPTSGTGTGVYLGTIVFEALSRQGYTQIQMTFDAGGNTFNINGVDESSSVSVGMDFIGINTPEPTTALLVGLGIVGLGMTRRRRA